ncbi:hypothetical protein [Nocardia nova]|uniref:hypothetical protein n=1 Tax=Nocardia nova TaxID=37330 RepID=UPI0011B03219|nr:hypothetical protein [Nocardia nova]
MVARSFSVRRWVVKDRLGDGAGDAQEFGGRPHDSCRRTGRRPRRLRGAGGIVRRLTEAAVAALENSAKRIKLSDRTIAAEFVDARIPPSSTVSNAGDCGRRDVSPRSRDHTVLIEGSGTEAFADDAGLPSVSLSSSE